MCCEHVAEANGDTINGFTHRDIAVRWTSLHIQLAFKSTTPKVIQCFYDVVDGHFEYYLFLLKFV